MLVGITGTPGTGKTTIAQSLREREIDVLDLKTTVAPFIIEYDEKSGANVVDVEPWAKANSNLDGFVEGAIAHYLPCEKIIVLRCRPDVLAERLAPRGYSAEKVRENAFAEALDVILAEVVDEFATEQIYEIDTTYIDKEKVVDEILAFRNGDTQASFGSIDWSEYAMQFGV